MTDMFKGPDGKVSMMRVISFGVCSAIMVIFIIHNVVSMKNGGGFVSIGATEAMLIAGVISAKAAQSFSENKKTVAVLPDDTLPTDKKE